MTIKSKTKASIGGRTTGSQVHLIDILNAVNGCKALPETRRRDLCSSIKRVSLLLGDEPAHIVLDLPMISAKLATVSPAAAGLTGKSFSNIRSNFIAAVKVSGLKSVQRLAKTSLSGKAGTHRPAAAGTLC
jgi:hypothetical protein